MIDVAQLEQEGAMSFPKLGKRGIISLEGNWEHDLRDRSSVLPTLHMLESRGSTCFIHRDVGTRVELDEYLKRLRPKVRYSHYEILHFAFHGTRGGLRVSDNEAIELSELAEHVAEITARRPIEAVYFGSCSTMAARGGDLEEFHRLSGARHVVGFAKEVDWIESAGFELMVLEALTWFSRVGDGINYLQRGPLGEFGRSLGFARFPTRP